MKSFLFTAALVFAGIWLWARLAKPVAKSKHTDPNTVPVDTGTFFGPFIDPITGAYLPPGTSPGAVQYQTQGVGLQ